MLLRSYHLDLDHDTDRNPDLDIDLDHEPDHDFHHDLDLDDREHDNEHQGVRSCPVLSIAAVISEFSEVRASTQKHPQSHLVIRARVPQLAQPPKDSQF